MPAIQPPKHAIKNLSRNTNSSPNKDGLITGRTSIVTPEGVRIWLTPASPIPRAWAWLIDLTLFAFAIFCVNLILLLIFNGNRVGGALATLASFVLYWGYAILCEVYFEGRTIGKRAMNLKVIRADGLPVSWRESITRNLLLVGDFLPLFYLTGLLCMLFDKQFRRVGDLVAGTLVVYCDAPPTRVPVIDAEPLALPYSLSPDQQRILIALFEREKRLPRERLEELATLAEPLTQLRGEKSLARLRSYVAGMSQ